MKPGVSLAAGAFCEFSLALVLNLAILYSMSEPLSSTHFAVDQAVHLLLLPCEFQAYMPSAYIAFAGELHGGSAFEMIDFSAILTVE